jgi:hypothetical protein
MAAQATFEVADERFQQVPEARQKSVGVLVFVSPAHTFSFRYVCSANIQNRQIKFVETERIDIRLTWR